MSRVTAIQIYLKPGVPDDELILRIWRACKQKGRPQDVFRRMLRAGMFAMVENGEMPQAVVDDADLERVIERRRRTRNAETVYPYGPHPLHGMPYPFYMAPAPAPVPTHQPAPARVPEPAEQAPAAAPQPRTPASVPQTAADSQAEQDQTTSNGKKRIAKLM